MLEELRKRIQHCCSRLRRSRNKKKKCWELLADKFDWSQTLRNNTQQHPTTWNRVCKRTQYVTSNSVGSCWPTMLRPFGRGLRCGRRRESQISNSLTKSKTTTLHVPNFTFCQQWQNSVSSWTQLSMSTYISKLCSSAFFLLHNISRNRKFLSAVETKSLVHAFVASRVDYCNSLLYGLPAWQLSKVQRVLNSATRLVCCAPHFGHIIPLMYELHWFPLK